MVHENIENENFLRQAFYVSFFPIKFFTPTELAFSTGGYSCLGMKPQFDFWTWHIVNGISSVPH